jgi:integrase
MKPTEGVARKSPGEDIGKIKLTESNIPKIKALVKLRGLGDYIHWDDALPGFGLRMREGRSSWIVQYKIAGKHRRIKLGTTEELSADEARYGWTDRESGQRRNGADKILAGVRDGIDYVVERATRRTKAALTVGAVVTDYLAAKKGSLKPRSYESITWHMEDVWKPLHGLSVDGVRRDTVAALLSAIAKRSGPAAANRARATLSAFYAWALGEGLCEENPVVGTNIQTENGPRDRVLIEVEEEGDEGEPRAINWAELISVWQALPAGDYGNIVKLLALTGCRRDEIGSMEWSEIDFDKRVLSIPGERTKNRKPHRVPLSPLALNILKAIPRRDRIHLFGIGETGRGYSGWSKSKAALDGRVKLKETWTLHDIRRTVRTGLGALGIQPHIAEAVINHLPPALVRTYDTNTYLKEKRAALDLWASELDVAIRRANGENVTTLRKA